MTGFAARWGMVDPDILRALQRLKALLCSLFVPFPMMSQLDSGESLSVRMGRFGQVAWLSWPIAFGLQGDRSGTK